MEQKDTMVQIMKIKCKNVAEDRNQNYMVFK